MIQDDLSYWITDYIFKASVLALCEEASVLKLVNDWLEQNQEIRKCEICDKEYRVTDLPHWIYFGSAGFKNCCFTCPIMERPRKAVLLNRIPEFVEHCGFIPTSNAGPLSYAFTSRLSEERWSSVFRSWASFGGPDHVRKKCGTWFLGLAESGVLPSGTLPTFRGVRCIAEDGHQCASMDEQFIDNWLTRHQIQHSREPTYPFHPTLNQSGRRRADWAVGDVFIEYFGLSGDPTYDEKAEQKIALAAVSGIRLIQVFPSDLSHLEKKLGGLVKFESLSKVVDG